MNSLKSVLEEIIAATPAEKSLKKRFLQRLKKGSVTQDANKKSHYCVFFLPFHTDTKKIFFVHHKKAQTWISPGGHIEKGELPTETIIREMQEELGYKINKKNIPQPFFLTVKEIANPLFPCKEHFDIWYMIETSQSSFIIDPSEFYETRWVTIEEALRLTTDENNISVLNMLQKNLGN